MGSFSYAGPSAAAAFTVGVFNTAEDIANERLEATERWAAQAVASASVAIPGLDTLVPPVIDTSVTPGSSENRRGLILAEMKADQLAVLNDITDLFESFIATNFPWGNEFAAAQAWVNRALTTGGTGLSPLYEQRLYERERSRVLGEAERAEVEAAEQWGARGYALPPGAAAAQLLAIQHKTRAELAAGSRDLAIKVMETEVENARIALSTAVDMRKSSIALALDYIKGMAFSYTFPTEQVVQAAAAATEVEKAATAYYQSQAALKELVARSAISSFEVQARYAETRASVQLGYVKQKVDALIAAMQSAGTQASAALNTLHGSAGYSGKEEL